MSASRFTEKIDVLDMIISILQEHEEKLDWLVDRLEVIADRLDPQTQVPQKHPPKGSVNETETLRRLHEHL